MDPSQRELLVAEVRSAAARARDRARLLVPVAVVLAVMCVAAAFLLGSANGWRLDAWVDGGLKPDSPLVILLFVLPVVGLVLIVWAVANLRAKTRELDEATARVADRSE